MELILTIAPVAILITAFVMWTLHKTNKSDDDIKELNKKIDDFAKRHGLDVDNTGGGGGVDEQYIGRDKDGNIKTYLGYPHPEDDSDLAGGSS